MLLLESRIAIAGIGGVGADKLDQFLDSDSVDQYRRTIASVKENLFIVLFIESNSFTHDDCDPCISGAPW